MGIIPGMYEHFKGGRYEVLGEATHSESGEKLVVYKSAKDGVLWVRPTLMFKEMVTVNDIRVPRFRLVSKRP